MQHVKIIKAPEFSNILVGYTYELSESRATPSHIRLTSIGGKFTTLVDRKRIDDGALVYEEVDAPANLKGWRNDHAVKLWSEVYVQRIVDGLSAEHAAGSADNAVRLFKERWEGDTFTHKVA